MTVVVASVDETCIAIAADGLALGPNSQAMYDNVKVVPIFGRFAIAWAGLEGLVVPDRFELVDDDHPPVDLRHPDSPLDKRDPINLAGRVRVEEIVREAERDLIGRPPPETCGGVMQAVGSALQHPLINTVIYGGAEVEHAFIKLVIAGWDSDDGVGYVMTGSCQVTDLGDDTYGCPCEMEPAAKVDGYRGVILMHQPDDLEISNPLEDASFAQLDVADRASRFVELVCTEYTRRGLPEQAGGATRCVRVTEDAAINYL